MFPEIPAAHLIIAAVLACIGALFSLCFAGFVAYHIVRALLFYVGVLS